MTRIFLLSLALCAAGAAAQDHPRTAPPQAPWQLRIAARDEPGVPLHVTGTVVDAAGRPVRNASLYVYQTDARGHYTPEDAGANRRARIHGHLRSDARGRFDLTTIRPGSYPGTRVPQHVHFVVSAAGFRERVFEIVFDDDPFVDARVRGAATQPNSAYSICKPVLSGTMLECTEKVVLLAAATETNDR